MASEAPNRHVSTAVTLTVLVILLVVGAVVGFRSLFAPIDGAAGGDPTGPSCTPQQVQAGKRVTSAEVTVSVFNASDRSGLANNTLNELANRGFKPGEVGNAPENVSVRFVQVWTTEENDVAARLVARQFGKGTVVKVGQDLGPGIDVVLGERFRGLVQAPKSIRGRGTQEVCVPTEDAG